MADHPSSSVPVRIVVDYAPAQGIETSCFLASCAKPIEPTYPRIKQEFESSPDERWYHLECYPFPISIPDLVGLDRLKEEDKNVLISAHSKQDDNQREDQEDGSESHDNDDASADDQQDQGDDSERDAEENTDNNDGSGDDDDSAGGSWTNEVEPKKATSAQRSAPGVKHKYGARVMAKVQASVARNIWFLAKVLSSRLTALGLTEYHVCYLEDSVKDTKEWVAERFLAPPVVEDEHPSQPLPTGTLALGWRRKPGSSSPSSGWWYSVKVLRYLSDVPGAFVHWSDFPFPDSILELSKIHLIQPVAPPEAKPDESAAQLGLKRQRATDIPAERGNNASSSTTTTTTTTATTTATAPSKAALPASKKGKHS